MKRDTKLKITVLGVACLVGYTSLEIAARILGYRAIDSIEIPMTASQYFWVADTEIGFANRANGNFENREFDGAPRVTSDSGGNRLTLPSVKRVQAGKRIAFIGDSTIFCSELDDDHTSVAHIQRKLIETGSHIECVNMGVRGYGTVQSLLLLRRQLTEKQEFKIAIYTFCDNDLAENIARDIYGVPVPYLQQANGASGFVKVGIDLGRVHAGDSLYNVSGSDRADCPRKLFRIFAYYSRSALLSALKGSFVNLETSMFTRTNAELDKESQQWGALESQLIEMKALCGENGIRLIVTRFSINDEKDFTLDDRLSSLCEKLGVHFVSVQRKLTDRWSAYVSHTATGLIDRHYGKNGALKFSEILFPIISHELTLIRTD